MESKKILNPAQIRNIMYKMYKYDWESRISSERHMQTLTDYLSTLDICDIPDTERNLEEEYNAYLFDAGYQGEMYACFDEFLEVEYKNAEYIKSLIERSKPSKQMAEILLDSYFSDSEKEKCFSLICEECGYENVYSAQNPITACRCCGISAPESVTEEKDNPKAIYQEFPDIK